MTPDDPYAPLAPLYDAEAADPGIQAFYCEWTESLLQVVANRGLRVRVLVDIACGTGNSTIPWLRQRGWTVVGVDRSEAMLSEARRKSSRVRWYRQDLTELDLPFRADLVTCQFDALNHVLTARGIQRVFHNVARLLNPGGLFQFDVATDAGMKWLSLHEKLFRAGEHFFVAVNEYDRRRRLATYHQHWFVHAQGAGRTSRGRRGALRGDRGAGLASAGSAGGNLAPGEMYERREVVVQERAYPKAALVAMLRRAGLRPIAARVQRKFDGKPARLLFIAERASTS